MRTTNRTRTRHVVAVTGLALVLALGGCGDDGDDAKSDRREEPAQRSAAGETDGAEPTGGGGSEIIDGMGIEGASEALDEVPLENKGSALVSAMKADRFEIEGDVLHVYVSEGSRAPAGTECMIVGSILSEGEKAVVHREDGSEVSCE